MVDGSYHLGAFLPLSALFFFPPVGLRCFVFFQAFCSSTNAQSKPGKKVWSNNCWHTGERTVCVCVSLHWYCGERKVGLIFRVVDAALCSLSVSDLRTSSVHLASQLAVRVNARLTVPMPFYNLLGLRCVEPCDTCGWLSNSHHFSFQSHLLNKKPTNIFRNNTSV